MCVISDKIKFCSCATSNVNRLKHYWILYRYNPNKDIMIVGEAFVPTDLIDINFEENQNTLLKRINEVDAFDIPVEFKNKDVLEIVINNKSANFEASTYSFQFSKNKLEPIETDYFYLANRFDEEKTGKIKNTLKK